MKRKKRHTTKPMRNALRATFAKPQTVTPNANKRKWLDLGSGQGRDAIALARLGFRDRNCQLKSWYRANEPTYLMLLFLMISLRRILDDV